MSHIADMSDMGGGALAVGWLHPDYPYSRGAVPVDFLGRLDAFLARSYESICALNWGAKGGYHTCEFCGKAWGTGIVGVLGGGMLFCVPKMIAHYVADHGYAPPAEFVSAVLSGPLPGTPAYASAAALFRDRTV